LVVAIIGLTSQNRSPRPARQAQRYPNRKSELRSNSIGPALL
jgi:hypothetical protein